MTEIKSCESNGCIVADIYTGGPPSKTGGSGAVHRDRHRDAGDQ